MGGGGWCGGERVCYVGMCECVRMQRVVRFLITSLYSTLTTQCTYTHTLHTHISAPIHPTPSADTCHHPHPHTLTHAISDKGQLCIASLVPIGGHHYLKLRVHGGVLPHTQGVKEGGKAGRFVIYIFNIHSHKCGAGKTIQREKDAVIVVTYSDINPMTSLLLFFIAGTLN